MRKALLATVTGLTLVMAPAAFSQSFLAGGQNGVMTTDNRGVVTMAPLLERVTPAVVSIKTEAKERDRDQMSEREEMLERFFGRQAPRSGNRGGGLGSGVIIDAAKGYILTNNHVIDDSGEIRVVLQDRRELVAELVGGDENTDIAVLKVDAKNLRDIKLARDDSTKVGDYVIAIGNPFGLGHTVTTGIVSGLGREIGGGVRYQDFIQTDASINPGNSGGALVNSKGELIGINTAILSRSGGNNGIGFAVPTKMARSVMNQLISYGEVRRGKIGVYIRDIDPAMQEAMNLPTLDGALVNDVNKGSPAERAGLQSGDIITAFNGDIIRDASDISNAVGMVEPGTRANIEYLRDGRKRKTKILVEASNDDEGSDELAGSNKDDRNESRNDGQAELSGAIITEIPEGVELRGGESGAYVARVQRGSKAARAGLARGDVIRRVGSNKITDLDDFEDAIADRDGPVALSVTRNGTNLFIAVR